MKGPFNETAARDAGLIVLSGLDVSGKTTQTLLLAARLRAEGIPAEAVWNRWKPAVSAMFITLARRWLKAQERVKEGDYRGFTDAKRRKMRSGWKRSVWQVMAWGEYAAQVRARLLAHRLKGATVLCDRYVYDTLVDIAINFSIPPLELADLMDHRLLSLFPKPAVVIFIDIDPATGAARKSDGTPAAYLADRRPYYTSLARILNAPVVDGGSSVESVASAIWNLTAPWREHRIASGAGHGRGAEQ